MTDMECVVDARNELGEAPTWCPRRRVVFWVDVMQGVIQQLGPANGAVRRWAIPRKPHVLALRDNGGLLLTIRNGFWFFDPETEKLEEIRNAEPSLPRNFVNDGKVDAKGRFWAGSVDRDIRPYKGELYRFDPDLTCHTIDREIWLANGIAWSPDNRHLYFADSEPQRLYVYDFDLDRGVAEDRRILVDFTDLPGRPDGITVDNEGYIWTAQIDGACLMRFDPTGGLERTLGLPITRPTSCQFGGDDWDVLYVTSARAELNDKELAAQPLAGGLFACHPGVRGLPPNYFAG